MNKPLIEKDFSITDIFKVYKSVDGKYWITNKLGNIDEHLTEFEDVARYFKEDTKHIYVRANVDPILGDVQIINLVMAW